MIRWLKKIFYDDQSDYGLGDTPHLQWIKHRPHYGFGLLGPAIYHARTVNGEVRGRIEWQPLEGVYAASYASRQKLFYHIEEAKNWIDSQII